jgi:hypothetical protein
LLLSAILHLAPSLLFTSSSAYLLLWVQRKDQNPSVFNYSVYGTCFGQSSHTQSSERPLVSGCWSRICVFAFRSVIDACFPMQWPGLQKHDPENNSSRSLSPLDSLGARSIAGTWSTRMYFKPVGVARMGR